MHSYQHHIKDFNNATRHLTRVERSVYRDAIELYYETEQPLPADDFDRLARRLLAFNDEEKAALRFILDEFFEKTGSVYSHNRCDEEIEKYHAAKTAKAAAGKASAEARRAKAEARKRDRKQQNSTGDEQVLNGCSTDRQRNPTNQEPGTRNHSNTPHTPQGGKSAIAIQTFIDQCKTSSEQAIPPDDPVFDYAGEVGIPDEFLHLCWREFVDRNRENGKRYKDWRKAFRNCVRGNWYRLWWISPEGDYQLTTNGKQAEKKHLEAA